MLIQFRFRNFLSFAQDTLLDMSAVPAYKEHPAHMMKVHAKESLLKTAAVYGANASGKSNLFYAFHIFQKILIESLNNVIPDHPPILQSYYHPFAFQQESGATEFEVILYNEGKEYKYGFLYNAFCIEGEWLYLKNDTTKRNTILFERYKNHVTFQPALRKICAPYQAQIPSETLFLSFFNRLHLPTHVFHDVYQSILKVMVMDTDFYDQNALLYNLLPKTIDSNKERLLAFLEQIDTGIKDITYEQNGQRILFSTIHMDQHHHAYTLPLAAESKGTIKSMMIYLYAIEAIKEHKTLLVDELNVKLHPLLLKYIIDLFYQEDVQAQLIYTTHDTTLLDRRFFRRDQIWFVEKDSYGHSQLHALSDYRIRNDASFEKDYLSGVYGGIPFLHN